VVRLADTPDGRSIETMHRAPVYRLRESLLPVVYLDRELGLDRSAPRPSNAPATARLSLLVLQAGGRAFGLVVDAIEDTEEIVVKPLGEQLRGVPTFAGATVLGDGRVVLILDVLGLARRARVIGESTDGKAAERLPLADDRPTQRQTHLLVATRDGGRVAVPLAAVQRLQELPRVAIETAGRGEVMQYRGRIVPVIRLSVVAGRRPAERAGDDRLQAVICTGHEGEVCLIVDRILDIVEEAAIVAPDGSGGAVFGSAVVQQRVTSLLDVDALIRRMKRRGTGKRQAAGAQA
jgi:two-component system chemotaxis sensor kinase CheA